MAASRKPPNQAAPPAEPFARLRDESLHDVLDILGSLAQKPPQTLLLEGGTADARMDAAKYWVALANCVHIATNRRNAPAPCLTCNTCRQIAANEFLDLSIHDGRISNTEDEENPGPVKALNMRRVRELKSLLAQPPHGSGKRGVILTGLPVNRDNAANALLKALEEPARDTLFVLLAPQRGQLLPTLVSRSFVLTLPWPDPHRPDDLPCESELGQFLANGKSFLDQIAARGALDSSMAMRIVLRCQKALMRVLAGEMETPLEQALAKARDPLAAALLARWLAEAQEMLQYAVAPARVMEGLLSRLFCLLHQ